MKLSQLQKTWDTLGQTDAMWAIITEDPAKLGHGWKSEEFFDRGQAEIDGVMGTVATLAPDLTRTEALDFGCGVGRLTRALTRYFERVTGIDIAPSMIEQARSLNASFAQCSWVLNDANDLRMFSDGRFDFIYTNLVLQHMKPQFALDYIREFVRVTAAGGLIAFQLPDKMPSGIARKIVPAILPFVPTRLLRWYRKRRYPNAPDNVLARLPKRSMEMHGIPKAQILQLLRDLGVTILLVQETTLGGADQRWPSWMYFARKA